MPVREIRKSLSTTEIIELSNGDKLIIDRKHTVETHRERTTEKENHSNIEKWKELDRVFMADLEQEHMPKLINSAEEGENFILKTIIEVYKEQAKDENFDIPNKDATLNWIKSKKVGFMLGTIRATIIDNIPAFVKFGKWLIENLQDLIIKQYGEINDPQVRGTIRNELLQYEPTRDLADKMRKIKA